MKKELGLNPLSRVNSILMTLAGISHRKIMRGVCLNPLSRVNSILMIEYHFFSDKVGVCLNPLSRVNSILIMMEDILSHW